MPENCTNGDPLPKWIFILKLNVCGIITVAAVLGSYFVLRAFHKFRNLRTASKNILVSLSIADGLLAIPMILDIINLCLLYNVGNCSRFLNLKEVTGTVTLFLLSVIVLHLSLMSSERFIAIKFALRYHSIVTKRRARIVSIAMRLWALVTVIALPWTLGTPGRKDSREFCRGMHPDSDTAQKLHHCMLLHLHLHSVLQAETTCQKTGPRLSRNANYQVRNERRPNSRHCFGAVSCQYHFYPCCDIPPSFLGQITRRPPISKVTAAYRL